MGYSQAQRRRLGQYAPTGRKGGGISIEMSAVGLRRLRATLQTLDTVASKEFTKAMKAPLQEVQRDAKGLAPRRTGEMRRGIKFGVYRMSGRRNFGGYKVWQGSPQGNILEFAGSTNPQGKSHSRSGEKLISTLEQRYGGTGRFIWKAFDRKKPKIDKALKDAIRRAEKHIQDIAGGKVQLGARTNERANGR